MLNVSVPLLRLVTLLERNVTKSTLNIKNRQKLYAEGRSGAGWENAYHISSLLKYKTFILLMKLITIMFIFLLNKSQKWYEMLRAELY